MKRLRPLGWIILCLIIVQGATFAQESIVIRIFWFDDGNESVILQQLTDEFERENPGVQVDIELFTIGEQNARIREAIADGRSPHLARTNEPGTYKENMLDLRPYLADAAAWEQNFNPAFLASLRTEGDTTGLYGYPTDVTISAPFINRTLWEEAGVPIPSDTSDEVTWDEWIDGATQVQAALSTREHPIFAIAIDRSGHRFWGPSLSMCATYVDPDTPTTGEITIDTEGFRETATMLKNWHDNNLVPVNIWTGNSDTIVPATEFFIDNQVAFYFSGNWQLGAFNSEISDFEWEVVPNPVGPCGQTGMVGGNTMIALKGAGNEETVGQLVDFLTQYDNLERFYRENLLLPGHIGMNEQGLEYAERADQLKRFQDEIARALPESFTLQYRPDSANIHGSIRRGLVEMLQQDLDIDTTIENIECYLVQCDTRATS